jgi:large subunit ribosomal protein L30
LFFEESKMSALKVKQVKSGEGRYPEHRATLRGLGLGKIGKTRILPDNPATRGMIRQIAYLVEWEQVDAEFKPFGKRARAKSA